MFNREKKKILETKPNVRDGAKQGGKKRLECYGLLNIYRFSFGVRLASLCKCVKMLLTSQNVCVLYGRVLGMCAFEISLGLRFISLSTTKPNAHLFRFITRILSVEMWNMFVSRFCDAFIVLRSFPLTVGVVSTQKAKMKVNFIFSQQWPLLLCYQCDKRERHQKSSRFDEIRRHF